MLLITDKNGTVLYRGVGPVTLTEITDATSPVPAPTTPAEVVNVPWVSQVLNSYRLDCGPACWTMIAKHCGVSTDLDSLIRLMNAANRKTDPDEAIACWQRLGLQTLKGSAITTWPHMSMVHYTALPERYDGKYVGLHFVIVLGVDARGNVVYHDPCWPSERQGAYKTMTRAQFEAAEHSVSSRVTARPA